MSEPAVSVIIPARDAAATLERTLTCLAAQQLDEPFEVVVIDDGSNDETAAIARRHEPFVTLIRNGRSEGAGSARNRGVRATRAPVLAFTDADCFPAPQWLARGLERVAHADLVQGRVAPDPTVARMPFDRTLVVESDGGFYQTANLFVPRETFDAVGGFRDWALEQSGRRRWSVDRRRGRAMRRPFGEDTLFAWSARRLGARSAFAEDALVYHAVFPGGVRDDVADHWRWATDMPGLARLVPELREGTFYRRWFFDEWTARFDLAVIAMIFAAVTRRRLWLTGVLPYADDLRNGMLFHRGDRETAREAVRRMAHYMVGAPAVNAATLVGLLTGSVAWRSLVL